MNGKLIILLLIGFAGLSASTSNGPLSATRPDMSEDEWVNSVYDAMTEDERLGQLFSIRAHSNLGPEHIAAVEAQIRKYHVGGLTFFQGTPEKQAELTNRYQALSKVPLMIAVDGEWGLGMRFKEHAISFPRQLMLGAIQDNRLIYEMGREVARQCRRIGIHVNFAPVVDVNNNANNPVINTRSFGEDRYNVAAKSYMYMKGMQDGNVIACAKHFPGHGDTDVDSHLDLPVISHSLSRLDSIELFPFRILVQHGVQSMMIAHLHVPQIDAEPNLPTTLSAKAVNDLLKKEMGFDGLIFTDALEMEGVAKHHASGEVEAKALLAGNDVLTLPKDVGEAVTTIKDYLADNRLTWERVEESVKKILRAKYRLGLTSFTPIDLHNIREDLNSPAARVLQRQLIRHALTLVRNEKDLLPLKDLNEYRFASLSIGAARQTEFQRSLSGYAPVTHHWIGKKITETQRERLVNQLKKFDLLFLSLHDMSSAASKDFGLTSDIRELINDLRKETKVVLTVFGNPYSLKYFDQVSWLLEAYEENEATEDLAAQALFGAFPLTGRLPVTASRKSAFNQGVFTPSLFRLQYDLPESVGLSEDTLRQIDDLVAEAIAKKATPGGVVLVAKDGKVVYHKAYGHHTYSKNRPVAKTDLYDLASITKIAAATISVMKLQEEGAIDIFHPMSKYLRELQNTNKQHLTIADMMAHRAGLYAWIPFFEQTVGRRKQPLSKFYGNKRDERYQIPVADNLYMVPEFMDEMWRQIMDSELSTFGRYKYSDLSFYLVSRMIEEQKGIPINQFVEEQFYRPLGLTTATYNPLEKFPREVIVPSEYDRYWRQRKVQGYVHDMGAAMLGGVSGHAGLFANANDLAILMQMLLNNGYYGGKYHLQPHIVKTFTSRHPESSRRGIGFDLKELDPSQSQNMCTEASENTFGHLGFTGTCAWADPQHNIIYVFLTNRTYPSMRNNKWGNEDFRPRIQSIVYKAMTD